MPAGDFKVIIVGGSIAGLTLALCLQRAGIDCVVLEKRSNVAPQEGASVGIMPNGGRILDQLGLFDAVENLVEPLESSHVCYPDGFKFSSQYPILLRERFGFPLAFLDRQKLLEILYNALPDKEVVVKTSKAVVRIEEQSDIARVYTYDGECYEGDLVVGADGVHSRVRAEIWRLANSIQGRQLSNSESKRMTAEYACVYGISSPNPKFQPGQQITRYNDGWSILSIVGKNGRLFWFLFLKLNRKYEHGSIPTFSAEDATSRCERIAAEPFWNDVTFGEVWEKREVCTMAPLEENLFQRWHLGRAVCIGDSMHKIAPHIGQGANCAMEDAAALTNLLHECLAKGNNRLSAVQLNTLLETFTAQRLERMAEVCHTAQFAMRLHARDGLFNKLLGRYFVPYAGDMMADKASQSIAQGICLAFITPSERSGPGWIQFKQNKSTRKMHLGLIASAILLVAFMVPICSSMISGFLSYQSGLPVLFD